MGKTYEPHLSRKVYFMKLPVPLEEKVIQRSHELGLRTCELLRFAVAAGMESMAKDEQAAKREAV